MTTNEGAWDRGIRILLAIAFVYAASITWPGTLGVAFGVLAAGALVTGLSGSCPAYTVFGFSTKKKIVA